MSEALAESMHQLVDSNKATQDILTKLVSIMGERESAQINKTDKLLSLMETLVGALTPKKGEVVESVKEEKETPEIKVSSPKFILSVQRFLHSRSQFFFLENFPK